MPDRIGPTEDAAGRGVLAGQGPRGMAGQTASW
jgi:hypothetical protein